MVAPKNEGLEEEDGKTELDLGIEESIRRCEALLAMVPLSLQASLADAALYESNKSTNNVRRTYFDLDLEAKLHGLEPQWRKNMGLLSSIKHGKSTPSSTSSRQSESRNSETPTQEFSTEKTQSELLKMSRPHVFPVTYSSVLMGGRSPPDDFMHQQRGHVKRRCGRGRQDSSVSDDWSGNVSQVGTSTSSVIGSQDEHHDFQHDEEVSNNTSSESGDSRKGAYSTVESSPEEDIENQSTTSLVSLGRQIPEKMTRAVAVPLPSAMHQIQDEEESQDEVTAHPGTYSDSMYSELDSQGSPPSFGPLCLTFTTPQHCEEAWEWFDKCSVDTAPGDKYEGNVVHETPQKEERVEHIVRSSWRPESHREEQKHLSLQSKTNPAELKPKGCPTNYRRCSTAPAYEASKDSKDNEPQASLTDKPGKLKMHTMASMRRLSVPRTAMYQRLAKAKAMREAERLSECSFKPTVGRRPEPGSRFSAPIIERIGDLRKRMDFRKRARKTIEKEERDQCSFWPQINLDSSYLDMGAYQPIQERLQDLLRKRDLKISQARVQEARELGLTFRPEINPNSARILRQRALQAPTVHRLHSGSPRTSDGSQEFSLPGEKLMGRRSAECTFAPEINPNTDNILAGTTLEGCSFLARQKQSMHKVEERKRIKEQEIPPDFTFKPKSGNADFILGNSARADSSEETTAQRWERLSHGDNQRRLCIRQQIAENYYAQFAFQPQIDKTSKILGENHSINDLHVNESGKHRMEEVEQKAQEKFQKACPFHPDVKVHTSSREVEDILENRRKFRQEKAKSEELKRVVKELQELSECTFKPTTHPLPPRETESVRIKGLRRHLELQGLAKQMKKEQEEWAKKVFFSHVYEQPRRQYTIPKPFSFYSVLTKRRKSPPRASGSSKSPRRKAGMPRHSSQPCSPCSYSGSVGSRYKMPTIHEKRRHCDLHTVNSSVKHHRPRTAEAC